ILTSIPRIFIGIYHESIGVAGLHYIAFGIGLYGGVQIANAIQDNLYRRLTLMLPPTLFVAIGLFIAGISATKAQYFRRHGYISFSGWSV
ncbi:hypothetical protein EDD18DRAFT_1079493, partial [Armillaria luteobubalina]